MQRNEVHTEVISRTECDICGREIMAYERGMNRRVLYNGADFCVSIVPMGRIADLCSECCEKILETARTGAMQY